jgi:predicted nucleic acid-binding protein
MPKSPLLIDTNIISHALTPNQTSAYAELFKELEQSYYFVVTGFTKFELMRSSDKSHRDKISEYITNDMVYVSMSETLMDFAARLCYLYSRHDSTKGQKISDGDVINAAYAIIKKSALITMDNNDYPTPFFQEVSRHRVTHDTGKNKEATDTVYILKPDMINLQECFKKHGV